MEITQMPEVAQKGSKLTGYDSTSKRRIIAIASELVEGQIVGGEIPCTEAAINAAMPEAVETARQLVTAANEFICG